MEKRFGKYILTERLGGGGMAEVFKARLYGPGGFEKDLAVKLILPQFSDEPEFVDMFIREATLAARLDHAAIVRIHEFDQIDGTYYIAMELVDGKDLRTIMARARQRGRNILAAEALMVAFGVCRGLAFAHGELIPRSAPIIHRDVSPHNIIISRAGEVKITDFGIAKMASAASITRTGVIKGKASYMSPEQARGETVDPRSDLFSLGSVMWEMLSGQRLFSAENDVAVLEKLQHGKIEPPSRYNPDVNQQVDRMVLKLLSRDPAGRYSSAGELSSELEQLLVAAGVERGSVLSQMYGQLFESERAATGLLPAPAADDSAGSAANGPPTLPVKRADSDSAVQPVGPSAPTTVDKDAAREPAAAGSPGTEELVPGVSRAGWRRPLFWSAAVVCLVLAALLISRFDWRSGAETADGGPASADGFAPLAPAALSVRPALKPDAGPAVSSGPAQADGGPAADKLPGHEAQSGATAGNSKPATEPPRPIKAPVRPEPARSAHGILYLNVIPWAKVYWKRRLLGDTPLERKRLPVGEQHLLLVNDDLHVKKPIKVKIRENAVTRKVVNLKAR